MVRGRPDGFRVPGGQGRREHFLFPRRVVGCRMEVLLERRTWHLRAGRKDWTHTGRVSLVTRSPRGASDSGTPPE